MMSTLLFPKTLDNRYRGQWLAFVFYIPVLLIKLLMGFNMAGFNPTVDVKGVLQDVDGIPLSDFSEAAVSELVFFANAWGFSLFVLCLISVVALCRYRAMVPLAILFLSIEQIGRKLMTEAQMGWNLSLDTMGTGGWINWGLSLALLLALILSVIPRRNAAVSE